MTLDMTALNGVVAAPPERTLAAHQGRLARPKHTIPASQWIRRRDVLEQVGQWPTNADTLSDPKFSSAPSAWCPLCLRIEVGHCGSYDIGAMGI